MPFTNANTSTHHRKGLTHIKTTVELSDTVLSCNIGLPKVVRKFDVYPCLYSNTLLLNQQLGPIAPKNLCKSGKYNALIYFYIQVH